MQYAVRYEFSCADYWVNKIYQNMVDLVFNYNDDALFFILHVHIMNTPF